MSVSASLPASWVLSRYSMAAYGRLDLRCLVQSHGVAHTPHLQSTNQSASLSRLTNQKPPTHLYSLGLHSAIRLTPVVTDGVVV